MKSTMTARNPVTVASPVSMLRSVVARPSAASQPSDVADLRPAAAFLPPLAKVGGPSPLLALRAGRLEPPDLSPVTERNVDAAFEANTAYASSLARFLGYARHLAVTQPNVELGRIPVESAVHPDLAVHTLTLHAVEKAENVVYLSSGTHGAEGPFGAVAQETFLRNHLPKLDRRNTTVVLIHGVNPSAWINNARSDEYNRDGNRSSDIAPNAGPTEGFAVVQATMTASEAPSATWFGNLWDTVVGLGTAVAKHGKDAVIRGLAEGQESDARAPLFRGETEPAHYGELRRQVFEPNSRDAKLIRHFDYHTGLGKSGVVQYMDLGNAVDKAARFMEGLSGDHIVHQPPSAQPYDTSSVDFLTNSIYTAPPGVDVLAYTVEVGGFDKDKLPFGLDGDSSVALLITAARLRERNRLQFFSAQTPPSKRAAILRRFTDLFNPPSHDWRVGALRGADEGLRRLVSASNSGGERPSNPMWE